MQPCVQLFAFGGGPGWFNVAVSGLRVDPDVVYDSFFNLFAVAYDDQSEVYVTVVDDATLDEMGKGVSAAQNIALLRWATELGVRWKT